MKRIFINRVLAFLLIGATLTYAGCKDYDDDIGNVQTELSETAAALQEQLGALQTALTGAQNEAAAATQKAAAAKEAADEAAEPVAGVQLLRRGDHVLICVLPRPLGEVLALSLIHI